MSPSSPAHLHALSDLAYQASAGGACWNDLLSQLAQHCGATGAALFNPKPGARQLNVAWGTVTDTSMHGWQTHWAAQDPWNRVPHLDAIYSQAGAVRHGHEFLDDSALRRTAYYQDFSRHMNGGRLLCLKVCADDDPCAPTTHLTLMRPLASKPFSDEQKLLLQQLWPHLRGAIVHHWGQQSRHAVRAVVIDMLDALPPPTWLLQHDGGVLCANEAARTLMGHASSVRMADGHLRALGSLDAAALSHMARLAAQGQGSVMPSDIVTAGHARRATVRVVSLSESSALRSAWPAVRSLLMVEFASTAPSSTRIDRVRQEHGLTPSEGDVLSLLAQGLTVAAIARQRGTTLGTVRSQLQTLFDKTGCRRQADLVRLCLG